jgi:hypothetical protein
MIHEESVCLDIALAPPRDEGTFPRSHILLVLGALGVTRSRRSLRVYRKSKRLKRLIRSQASNDDLRNR